jgi:hypothetical protein
MRPYEIFLQGEWFGSVLAYNQADARFKVAAIINADYLPEARRTLYVRRARS